MTDLNRNAEAFKAMHQGPGILVLPNAWDPGSAVLLERAGFAAIGTTSAGIAFAQGVPDGEKLSRQDMLDFVRGITSRVSIPVTADLEAGYGLEPADVATTVRGAIEAGAVGANFEDAIGEVGLLDEELCVERIRAGREAADALGIAFVINARTDVYLVPGDRGADTFDAAVRRANAYLAAGADCAFVPGTFDLDLIERLADGIEGPLNVLGATGGRAGSSAADLEAAGVARVSIGSSLSLATLGVVQRAAAEILGSGTFTFAEGAPSYTEMMKTLAADARPAG